MRRPTTIPERAPITTFQRGDSIPTFRAPDGNMAPEKAIPSAAARAAQAYKDLHGPPPPSANPLYVSGKSGATTQPLDVRLADSERTRERRRIDAYRAPIIDQLLLELRPLIEQTLRDHDPDNFTRLYEIRQISNAILESIQTALKYMSERSNAETLNNILRQTQDIVNTLCASLHLPIPMRQNAPNAVAQSIEDRVRRTITYNLSEEVAMEKIQQSSTAPAAS